MSRVIRSLQIKPFLKSKLKRRVLGILVKSRVVHRPLLTFVFLSWNQIGEKRIFYIFARDSTTHSDLEWFWLIIREEMILLFHVRPLCNEPIRRQSEGDCGGTRRLAAWLRDCHIQNPQFPPHSQSPAPSHVLSHATDSFVFKQEQPALRESSHMLPRQSVRIRTRLRVRPIWTARSRGYSAKAYIGFAKDEQCMWPRCSSNQCLLYHRRAEQRLWSWLTTLN